MNTSDRIEKQITLRAPVSRVWRAITDAGEFAQWFGFTLDGPFTPGKVLRGTFDRPMDEATIAGMQESQRAAGLTPSGVRMPEGKFVFGTVDRVEPEHYFSYRWIPYGIDAEADTENEPTTLVEFRLEPVAEGTRLTVVESGFDRVPAHRRARAFHMNSGGWMGQLENIRKHVERA
jgi:uncharacterized protein YndB with AHSA1/START domain